jgi:hypothetical protein
VRWKLAHITGAAQTVEDRNGSRVISTAPSIAIFSPEGNKFARNYNQLLIYRSEGQMTAYLTGKKGKTVTDQLPQERWEQIHSQAMAAFVIIGRVPDNFWQEII